MRGKFPACIFALLPAIDYGVIYSGRSTVAGIENLLLNNEPHNIKSIEGDRLMKRKNVLLFTVTTCILLLFGLIAATAQTQDLSVQAGKFVTLLSEGEYESATGMFDKTMKSALSKEKLEEVWQSLQSQCGAFKAQGDMRKNKIQQYDVVYVPCQFEKATLESKIVFDQNGMIAGLFFVPPGTE